MKTSIEKIVLTLSLFGGIVVMSCDRDIFSPFEKLQASNDPDFECGCDMVDERDGRVYKTVQIGGQCWMAQNLNYGQIIEYRTYLEDPSTLNGQLDNGVPEKLCLGDNPNNCEEYGGFYTWEELMDYPSPTNLKSTVRGTECSPDLNSPEFEIGLCPSGWKVASDFDWQNLQSFLDPAADVCDTTGSFKGNSIKFKLLHPDLCGDESDCGQSGFNSRFVGAIVFDWTSPNDAWRQFDNMVKYWTSTPTGYIESPSCIDSCGNCRGILRELQFDSPGILRTSEPLYRKQDFASLCNLPKDRHRLALPCRCIQM